MELTFELYVLGALLSACLTVLVAPIVLDLYLKWKLPAVSKIADNVTQFVDADGSSDQLSDAMNSIVHIGGLASNANEIMANPKLMEGLMADLANRVMKSFKMSMMGTASGDVKKMAKAERLVNEALIEGVKQMSPWINIALKATGLDEELKEDPEMFGLIMQVLTQNEGLMGMLGSIGGLDGITQGQEQALVREATQTLGNHKGIEF